VPTSRDFFDAIAPRYDRQYAFSGTETRRRGAPLLHALGTSPRRILDLGIGTGRELAMLLDAGHDVVGIDASAAMIAECNKRARTVRIAVGDFYEPLPWDDASFDAVIALHGTLAHPPFDGAHAVLFAEVARVLRPHGPFWFEVPHDGYLPIASQLGHAVQGDTFVATDAKSALALSGVAWPEARWTALLAPHFTTQLAPAPSPFEHAFHAERA
jgi:SAM-dependent methyltransferase